MVEKGNGIYDFFLNWFDCICKDRRCSPVLTL